MVLQINEVLPLIFFCPPCFVITSIFGEMFNNLPLNLPILKCKDVLCVCVCVCLYLYIQHIQDQFHNTTKGAHLWKVRTFSWFGARKRQDLGRITV